MNDSTTSPAAQSLSRVRANIPEAMRSAKRWLIHDAKKIPYYASGTRRAGKLNSPRDLERLVTFDDACAALLKFAEVGMVGLGFALGEGWVGCDLDDVRTAETGETLPWAAEIITEALKAGLYTEVSPSQKGVHIIAFIDDPEELEQTPTLGANGSGVELYKSQRYFTVTGITLARVEMDPGGGGKRKVLANVGADSIALLSQARHKKREATTDGVKPIGEGTPSIEWPGFALELSAKLQHVPPGRPRERWLAMSFGIHHASGGSEQGFKFWHDWSARATDGSYTGEADLRRQWAGFNARHKKPVTWGTVKKILDEFTPKPQAKPAEGKQKLPLTMDSAADLYEQELQPVERLTVGRLEFTPGVTVLAGKPKHGKSWLALGCAVAFTTGDTYLESSAAAPMQALYVACDDPSRRRMANRLRAIKPKVKPAGLLIVTAIAPEAGSSLDLLGEVIKTHPAIRFVVIDTLSAFRKAQRTDSPYQQEYDEVKALNDWAHQHDVAVLLVHHLRKGVVDVTDPYESISGTLGLQGACDGLMVLARRDLESDVDEALDEKLAGLWYRGRDLDNDVATGIALAEGRWRVYGRGRITDVFAADTRRAILRVLESDPARWWTAKEIHATGEFSCQWKSVQRTASRMARSKEIDSHHGARGAGLMGGFRAKQ